MLQELRKKLRIRFAVPCGVPLGIRNLYVWPNKGGWILLLILLAMLAFGINYQNNLVLILAVFLLCVIFTSVFYGFFNMNGVGIEIKKMNIAVHAGTTLPLPVFVTARAAPGQFRIVRGLRITAPGATALIAPDLATGSTVQLSFANEKRGIFRVPLLAVCSSWPLGIINTFSYINPETEILIYPRPVSCEYLLDRLPDSSSDPGIPHPKNRGFPKFRKPAPEFRVGTKSRESGPTAPEILPELLTGKEPPGDRALW